MKIERLMTRSVVTVGAEALLEGVARLLPWEHGRLGAETASSVAEAVTKTRTQHFRAEHERMARDLGDVRRMADELPELGQAQRNELVKVVVDLFRRFQRHALAEERDFYPKLTSLLGDPRPAAAMTYDHRALELGTAELAAFDLLDVPRLQALLYGLHTLLIAHMHKEDEIVFPMLEQLKIEPAGLQQRVEAIPPPWDVQLHD